MSKTRLVTMRGCNTLVGCWVVPNVPNAEFFTSDGDALHGTYWHNQFGKANLSHGCVNLTLTDAAWLYDWTSVGTDVIVV
jgi:lipoprotein-anchoring transpeptidase ErfK/SrfK